MTRRDEEALRMAFQQLSDDVWSAVDQKVSDRLGIEWVTPPQSRHQVEESFLRQPGTTRYDPTRSEDRRTLSTSLSAYAFQAALAMVVAFRQNVANLSEQQLRKFRVKKPKAHGRPFIREKPHARNLELAWFVVERVISFGQLLHGADLRPGRRGSHGTPWDSLAEEWNRTHPHVQQHISSGRTLKDEYYRAVRKTHFTSELLTQFEQTLDEEFATLHRLAQAVAPHLAPLSDEETELWYKEYWDSPEGQAARRDITEAAGRLRRLIERTPLDRLRALAQERSDRYRAGLTRQDLIRNHLLEFILWDSSKREEHWQKVNTPLRYWFLEEARAAKKSGQPKQQRPAKREAKAAKTSGQQKRRPAGTQKKAPNPRRRKRWPSR